MGSGLGSGACRIRGPGTTEQHRQVLPAAQVLRDSGSQPPQPLQGWHIFLPELHPQPPVVPFLPTLNQNSPWFLSASHYGVGLAVLVYTGQALVEFGPWQGLP